MNFYKHHIGDYAQATSHLTFVEDAAYSRLIRKYYADERPLPADLTTVQRLVGARTKEEKSAVEVILKEFFSLEPDGWHNKRCDQEIAKASMQAETNRRIAAEREARRKEKRRANKTAIYPNAGADESSTSVDDCHHSLVNDSSGEPCVTQKPNVAREPNDSLNDSLNDSCSIREPSQTPDSRLQTPDLKERTFPISATWKPSSAFWSMAMSAGISDDAPDFGPELAEFIAYWHDKPSVLRTQVRWERTFLESWQRHRSFAESRPQKPKGRAKLSPHSGFAERDYTVGVNPDGSF